MCRAATFITPVHDERAGGAAEGLTLSKITALANTTLEFSIPVYKNMPAGACVKPTWTAAEQQASALGVVDFANTDL